MPGRYIAFFVTGFALAFVGGWALERHYLAVPVQPSDAGPRILYWVAPMDPDFRRDGPGKSPMGMDLVPVYEGDEPSGDPAEVQLTAAEINAIGVRTARSRLEDIAGAI